MSASFDIAADNAAASLVGESAPGRWPNREAGSSPERLRARASLHAYLTSDSPEVVLGAFWAGVEHTMTGQSRPPPKSRPFAAVPLRSAAELAMVQQRAPWALPIRLVEAQSDDATPEAWPPGLEAISLSPPMPSWLSASVNRSDFASAWRRLMVERMSALAYASYDTHHNPNQQP